MAKRDQKESANTSAATHKSPARRWRCRWLAAESSPRPSFC